MDGPPDAQAHGWVALVPRDAAINQSDAVSVCRGHRAPGGARRGSEGGYRPRRRRKSGLGRL